MFTIPTDLLMMIMDYFQYFLTTLIAIFPNLNMFEIDGGASTLVVLDATPLIEETVTNRIIL